MPIYEYEPDGHDCLMCEGRVSAIQGINDEPLKFCPDCGLGVRRIISRFNSQIAKGNPINTGEKQGFTTYRKMETGKYERIAGSEGPETFEAPKE